MNNKIQCSHILIEKQSQALLIIERIKKGEKFGKIAREMSLCPSAKRWGFRNFWKRNDG